MATLGLSPADKEAVEQFRRDVVEPSMTALVIIDFWAEWCGPCKALSPVLEKIAADYAAKGVVLAKIDVDANTFIAAQFQVRSIPTVYAMFQGQIAADLTSARTESQLKAMLDQLLKQLPIQSDEAAQEAELEPLIAMAEGVLAEGDAARATGIFAQLSEMAPFHPAVAGGLARALVAEGRIDEAEAALVTLPEDSAKAPEIARARSAIDLARSATPVEDLSGLVARVAADPDDHDAAMQLAGGQMAAGDRDAAAATLLVSIATDKDWNEGAARHQLLKVFEAVGLEDPWVSAQRRKLSAILFRVTQAPFKNVGATTRLSVFPLPGALLFPRMHLPLHIFEPRYRAMIGDSLARDRRIGMVQPRGVGNPPPLFDIGCVGKIADIEALDDGRYNLVLEGVAKFRIIRELDVTTPFRQVEAVIEPADITAALSLGERASLESESRKFADAQGYAVDWEGVARLDDEALVNGIAQIAPFDPASKQALLEATTLSDRCELIVQLMAFFSRHDDDDTGTLQ